MKSKEVNVDEYLEDFDKSMKDVEDKQGKAVEKAVQQTIKEEF